MRGNIQHRRELNSHQAMSDLRPALTELGVTIVNCLPDALQFKFGDGSSAAWAELSLNELNLYDLEIFAGQSRRHGTIRVLRSIHSDDLAQLLIAEWRHYRGDARRRCLLTVLPLCDNHATR